MEHSTCHFTLLFQPPFWVGLAERWDAEGYRVSRTVFGPEPTQPQLYQWLLANWHRLEFSAPAEDGGPRPVSANPKRARRQAARALQARGTGTQAQRALAAQRERDARAREAERRAARRTQEEERFQLRKQKKREKRRGR